MSETFLIRFNFNFGNENKRFRKQRRCEVKSKTVTECEQIGEKEADLDGGVATAVEDLASLDGGDGCHRRRCDRDLQSEEEQVGRVVGCRGGGSDTREKRQCEWAYLYSETRLVLGLIIM